MNQLEVNTEEDQAIPLSSMAQPTTAPVEQETVVVPKTSDRVPVYEDFQNQPVTDPIRAPRGYDRATNEDMIERTKTRTVDTPPMNYQTDQDELMPRLERALQFSDNPERDRQKAYASVYLADRLGADPMHVFENFPQYTQEYYGVTTLPEQAWTLVKNDFNRGVGSITIGHIGTDLMLSSAGGNMNMQTFESLLNAVNKLPAVTDQDRNFWNKSAGDVANFLPSIGATLAMGYLGAKVGGLLGPKGAAAGFILGGASEAFSLAAGNIYADVVMMEDPTTGKPMYQAILERPDNFTWNAETQSMEQIYDKEEGIKRFLQISGAFATAGGVLSALIEIPQMDLLTGGKILNDVVGKHLSELATKALSSSVISNSAARFFINHGLNVAEETLQEGIQESVEWWATELSKRDIVKELELEGVPQGTIQQYIDHVESVFASTSRAMLFMGIPGSASMSGFQAVQDKRNAMKNGDLAFNATIEDVYTNIGSINTSGGVSQTAVRQAGTTIQPGKTQSPIAVVEREDGGYDAAPSEEARIEAMKIAGVTDVAVKVAPYTPVVTKGATPEQVAMDNGWAVKDGNLLVNSGRTINKLLQADPNAFQEKDGKLYYTPEGSKESVVVTTAADHVYEESGLKEQVEEIQRQMPQMNTDMQEQAEEFVTAVTQSRMSEDYVGAYRALRGSDLLKNLEDSFMSSLDETFQKIEEVSEQIVPEEAPNAFTEKLPNKEASVKPYEEVEGLRSEYETVIGELNKINDLGNKSDAAIERMRELQVRVDELMPFQESAREQAARRATEGYHVIPDNVLNEYKDRPWAANEIAHRKVLKETAHLYTDAATATSVVEFEEYVMSDFYWAGKEEQQAKFMEALPEDPTARKHFFQDLIDRSYFKYERNLSDWMSAIDTDAGLESWLLKVNKMDLYGAGFSADMNRAIKGLLLDISPNATQLQRIRASIKRDPAKWQNRFYSYAALTDPDLAYHMNAQKDYEYIMMLEEQEKQSVPIAELSEEDKRVIADHKKELRKILPDTIDDKDATVDFMFNLSERVAKYNDMSLREWLDAAFIDHKKPYGTTKRRGSIGFVEHSIGIRGVALRLKKDGAIDTVVHEYGHIFRRWMKPEDLKPLEDYYGAAFMPYDSMDDFTNLSPSQMKHQRQREEDFAEDFTKYVMNGVVPNSALKKAFDAFGRMIKAVLQATGISRSTSKGKVLNEKLHPTVKALFDTVFEGEENLQERPAAEVVEIEKKQTEKVVEKKLTKTQAEILALKDALKSARQEAALAMKAALDEKKKLSEAQIKKVREKGIAKIEMLERKMRAKLKEQAQARKTREKILKLATQIKKAPAKGINLRVRDKIMTLQGLLDDHFTTKANVDAWKEEFAGIVKKYNDQGLEALVTNFGLSPRPLNLWTVEELTALKEYIDGLRKSGREYQIQLENDNRAEYRSVREYIIDKFSGGKPPSLPPVGSVEGKKARKSGILNTTAFWSWRPSRIFRMLDGWVEGKFYHFFVTKTNLQMDKIIAQTKRRRDLGERAMEKLGLTVEGLAQTEQIGENNYTRDAMLHVWMAMQNEHSALAIVNGNRISEAEVNIMTQKLTQSEKAWGEWMMQEFAENFPRMEEVYETYMNEHLKQEKAYFPMIRLESSWEGQDKDFWDQFKLRNEYRKGGVDRSSTYERATIKNSRQGAIALGATHIWSEQVEKHEHWINMGMHVRDMNNIVHRNNTDNVQFKNAMESQWGSQGMTFMDKYIEDVANPTLYKGHDAVSRVSRRLRKNAAIGYLAYNALTMAKQAPSLALFLREVGPHRLLAASGKYMANVKEWQKFVDEHDPQMGSRVITKELELMKQKEKHGAFRAVDAVGAFGMKGIQTIDKIVTHIGWLAVYDKYVNTLGSEEAARKAQMAVLETQPSARAKDLAQLYRSGEVLNWFTMFSNQLNNIWNMVTADTIYAFRNREYDRLVGNLVGVGISTFSMMLMAGYRPGEEDEEHAKEFLKSTANFIPLIGKNISGGIDGWNTGGVEPLPIAGEFGRVIDEGFDLDGKGVGNALIGLAKAGGVAFGIPVTGLVNRPTDVAEAMISDGAEAKDMLELFGQAYVGDKK